jgi:hypothetical protein
VFEVTVLFFRRSLYAENTFSFGGQMIDLGFIENRSYHKRLGLLKSLYSQLAHNQIPTVYCCSVDHALLAIWAGKKVFLELGDLHQLGRFERLYRRLDAYLLKRIAGLVLTSPFFESDYYKSVKHYDPHRILTVENKLPEEAHSLVLAYRGNHRPLQNKKKSLGIIGSIRFPSVLYKIKEVISRRQSDLELHLYGDGQQEIFIETKNCQYHGPFRNPQGLPSIYESIDVNLICYDVSNPNVKPALPNKLYESVAFLTPIICMRNCRLEVLVTKFGLGCATDVENLEQAINRVFEHYDEYMRSIQEIDSSFYIDDDSQLLNFVTTRMGA